MIDTVDAPSWADPALSGARAAEEDVIRRRLGRLGERLPSTMAPIRPGAFWQVARRLSVGRSLYYSLRFRGPFLVARGTRVVLRRGARVEFRPGAYLLLGFHQDSPSPVLLNMGRDTRLIVKGTVQAWRGSQIMVLRGGRLEIGDRYIFNEGARLTCCHRVELGSAGGMSWGSSLMDTDLHPIYVNGRWRGADAPVVVGDRVMIGSHSIILKGVTLGENCIVAAGSVVTSDVPARTMVAGNPARVVREGVDWGN